MLIIQPFDYCFPRTLPRSDAWILGSMSQQYRPKIRALRSRNCLHTSARNRWFRPSLRSQDRIGSSEDLSLPAPNPIVRKKLSWCRPSPSFNLPFEVRSQQRPTSTGKYSLLICTIENMMLIEHRDPDLVVDPYLQTCLRSNVHEYRILAARDLEKS